MQIVRSTDGIALAYDTEGRGPALILVDGALTTRASGSKPALVAHLAPYFTVYSYDRRGRGDSGDAPGSTVAQEIADLAAVIAVAGGAAYVYGHSSGGALAFDAVEALGSRITKLAVYEVPYNDDPAAKQGWATYVRTLRDLLVAGQRGDALALFLSVVGTPAAQIAEMRRSAWWPALEAVAPTLAYDQAAISDTDGAVPVERARDVNVPVLVLSGSAGDPSMAVTARTLSAALPQAQLRILEGENHNVHPEVIAPVLVDFFLGGQNAATRI